MTTTNRAFIKAYRHDTAQPAPAPPIAWSHLWPTESATRADDVCSSVEYVAVAAGRDAPAIAAFSTTTIESESPASMLPTLKSIVGQDHTTGPPVESRPILRAGAPAHRHGRGPLPKRPLSTFAAARTARRGAAPSIRTRSVAPAPPSGVGFQTGSTIASFRWPGVCGELWRECGDELERVGEQLITAAKESRSLVGVIGLFPGHGCTTTLLSLAGPLAARGGRVVVVDGNFRTPKLGSLLGVETDTTWQDVLARGVPVGDAIVHAVDDNLDLLPYLPHPANHDPSDWSIGLHASVTAGVLRWAYDLALVDLGAFFTPETRPLLLELVRGMRLDHAIAVAEPESADPRDLDTLGEYLDECGCQLLGTIENRAA